ncbi:MAG: hypothetical protein J0I12_28985 [Candidatus Eremiobacteraeota bacterium]|nr:hypothetical protein [Candidatus Eremiobacteraeota bacterium]
MSRHFTTQTRRANRKVSRSLQGGGEQQETRLSSRRLARAELRAQDLEMELYED